MDFDTAPCAIHRRTGRSCLGSVRLGQLGVRHDGHGRVFPGVLPEILEHRRRPYRNYVAPRLCERRRRSGAGAAGARARCDCRSRRAPQAFLFAWTLLGVVATGALYFVAQGQWFTRRAVVRARQHGLQRRHRIQRFIAARRGEARGLDRVSAFGYSLGYLGGGLLFLVNVLMYASPAGSGCATAHMPCRHRSSRWPCGGCCSRCR